MAHRLLVAAAIRLAKGGPLPAEVRRALSVEDLADVEAVAKAIKHKYRLTGQDKNPYSPELKAQKQQLLALNPGALDPNQASPDSNQVLGLLPSAEAARVHAVERQFMQSQQNQERLSNRDAIAASKLRKRK